MYCCCLRVVVCFYYEILCELLLFMVDGLSVVCFSHLYKLILAFCIYEYYVRYVFIVASDWIHSLGRKMHHGVYKYEVTFINMYLCNWVAASTQNTVINICTCQWFYTYQLIYQIIPKYWSKILLSFSQISRHNSASLIHIFHILMVEWEL